MGDLSGAGGIAQWEYVGSWAAAMLGRGLISETEIPESAKAIWEEPCGDRRQELAFIWLNLNLPALRADLEALLASPQE